MCQLSQLEKAFTCTVEGETELILNNFNNVDKCCILSKFYFLQVETSPNEFALYIIHATGEKKKLKNTDCPLWERLLQGPSGNIARMFLMDKEAEEISSDVAQYIKFGLPLLESFLKKLNEEEEREIKRTIDKYIKEKSILLQHLNCKILKRTETTV
ncbi:hypothetical protein FKM82_021868 [Ascaphus truei]